MLRISLVLLSLLMPYSGYSELLYHWTQLAPDNQYIIRAVIDDVNCPTIHTENGKIEMQVRSMAADNFPVQVCELALADTTKFVKINKKSIAVPKSNPKRIIVLGDTGCGLNKEGAIQNCEDQAVWPFKEIAKQIIKSKPDLIIHLGDLHYRDHQCREHLTPCNDNTGFGFVSWQLDFFDPAANLLSKAPWVMVRGNHENCSRAWSGWNRFFSLEPYSDICIATESPKLISNGKLDLLLFDNSEIEEGYYNESLEKQYNRSFSEIGDKLEREHYHNTWLLSHRPFWINGFDLHSNSFNNITKTYAKEEDWSKLKDISLVLSAHIHLFQALGFVDINIPPQFIIGNGGNNLVTTPLTNDAEVDGHAVYTSSSVQKFGYVVFDKEFEGWKATVKDVKNKPMIECYIKDKILKCNSM